MYNETIRDLLVPDSRALCLREDPAKGCGLLLASSLKVSLVFELAKRKWNSIAPCFSRYSVKGCEVLNPLTPTPITHSRAHH